MHLRALSHFLYATLAAISLSGSVFADLSTEQRAQWESIASGDHSYRKLGPAFYVELPMRLVPDSRLVFFNRPLAERLGLPVPEDPRELEELMLSLFAVEIDPSPPGHPDVKQRTMIATRYLDGDFIEKDGPNGDGRLVWAGEIRRSLPNDRVLSLDVTIKGVGSTPLAWRNHPHRDHHDGRQPIRELVRSAIIGRMGVQNELDVTDDLMGFAVGDSGNTRTVRIGNQTRVAHFAYFKEHPENFRTLFNYVVARDLGVSAVSLTTDSMVREYFEHFVKNLAAEAARYDDLEIVHGSPTKGNRTTKGSTIDLLEIFIQDANHQRYPYLYGTTTRVEQYGLMRGYATGLLKNLSQAKYPVPEGVNSQRVEKLFDETYRSIAADLALSRIGLTRSEARFLTSETRRAFIDAALTLKWADGTEIRQVYGQKFIPAAFDLRSVFRNTFAFWGDPERTEKLFYNERPWATPLNRYFEAMKRKYLEAVDRIVAELSVSESPRAGWRRNAEKQNRFREPSRFESAKPGDPFYERYDLPIAHAIERHAGFAEIDALIDEAARELIDPGLFPRGITNLGWSPGTRRYPPPPHPELCRKAASPAPANSVPLEIAN